MNRSSFCCRFSFLFALVCAVATAGSACESDSGDNGETNQNDAVGNGDSGADGQGGNGSKPAGIFRINQTTLGDQLRPRAVPLTAGALAGGVAVVWQDGASSINSAVKIRLWDKNGVAATDERQVATGQFPDIAISPDGQRLAVVFSTGEGNLSAIVVAQLFAATGEQDGDLVVFAKGKSATRPRISTGSDGTTWVAYEIADNPKGTTATGEPHVDVFAVMGPYPAALAAATEIEVVKKGGRQSLEGLAAVSSGAVVSFWEPGLVGKPGPYVVHVGETGAKTPTLLSEVLGAADFAWPTVAPIPDGTGAVALWYEWVGSGLSVQPALQVARLDGLAKVLGTPGTVATFDPPAPVEGTSAHVALSADKSALVAWSTVVQLSGTLDIVVKPLSQTGEVVGSLEVLTKEAFASGKQLRPFVTALHGGGYLVLWDSDSGADPEESPGTTGIYGRYMNY